MKPLDNICGIPLAEIDAARCYLTYEGALKLNACSTALKYWSSKLKRRTIEITAANLQKFEADCDEWNRESMPRWGRVVSIQVDCWGPTYEWISNDRPYHCYDHCYDNNNADESTNWKVCERVLKANIILKVRERG